MISVKIPEDRYEKLVQLMMDDFTLMTDDITFYVQGKEYFVKKGHAILGSNKIYEEYKKNPNISKYYVQTEDPNGLFNNICELFKERNGIQIQCNSNNLLFYIQIAKELDIDYLIAELAKVMDVSTVKIPQVHNLPEPHSSGMIFVKIPEDRYEKLVQLMMDDFTLMTDDITFYVQGKEYFVKKGHAILGSNKIYEEYKKNPNISKYYVQTEDPNGLFNNICELFKERNGIQIQCNSNNLLFYIQIAKELDIDYLIAELDKVKVHL